MTAAFQLVPCAAPRCSAQVASFAEDPLCGGCGARLLGALRSLYERSTDSRGVQMATLVEEVRTTALRQGRLGKVDVGVISHSDDTMSALGDHRADSALRDLRTLLHGLAEDLWTANMDLRTSLCLSMFDDRPRVLLAGFRDAPDCGNTVESIAVWLVRRPTWLTEHAEAAGIYVAVMDAVQRCWRVIDRAGPRWYAGPCDQEDCVGDVYGPEGGTVAKCVTCGSTYDIEARRATLLSYAMKLSLTAAEMSKALPQLMGRTLAVQTIHTWARNGRIVVTSRTKKEGWPMYLVADVVAVALETPTRRRGPRHADVDVLV